ncbi:MAG: hypothetical protein GQ574_01525 [Crocinitomix sp.]|nr:hypothetical protein [Crocinitomix sp.]
MVEMNFNCPENIGEMAPTKKGRFCDSCQKDIVDYTAMSKPEIREQLKNASSKTCGIFNKRQIMNSNRVEIGSRFRLAFMMVFMLGLSSTDILAQDTLTTFPPIVQTEVAVDTNYTINGSIVDADSMTVPFAKVWIEVDTTAGITSAIYAISDEEGKYVIVIPNDVKAPLSIMARSVGHVGINIREIKFEPGKNVVQVDILFTEEMEMQIIGMISICPLLILQDPYEFGKTKLDGEDLRQWD